MSKSALSPIELRVAQQIENYFSQVTTPEFVIGVSGGPDSMALLYIFKKLHVNATVVHINYQKRATASEKDQELVEKVAGDLGFDCKSVRLNPEEAKNRNFQEWARDKRYHLFKVIQREVDADAIVTAHHQDDQIETILQKLFRGAGLEAWSAMEVWDEPLFRPMLTTTRQQIMTYIEKNDIPYRTDQSNLKSEFARNLLRNEWLDKLEDFFPGWRQNVLRIPQQAVLFTEVLNYIESDLVDKIDRIDLAAFKSLSLSLQKAFILHLLKKRDPSVEVTAGALDQIEEIAALQTGRSIQLTEHYSLMSDREWLKIVFEEPEEFKFIELEKERLNEAPFNLDGITYRIQRFSNPDFENVLYLDCAELSWPVCLRRWRAGDQFQPFGMSGHQKVSDHLTNRKISAAHKGKSLVLESFEGSICAVVFPSIEIHNPPGTISESVKCTESTTNCLVIEYTN